MRIRESSFRVRSSPRRPPRRVRCRHGTGRHLEERTSRTPRRWSFAITPALASGWQMTNDGASWTFALRDGVRFHDGNALDAAAVVASFERGMTSRGSAYRALFADPAAILSVQAVDPRTVRFDLRAPFGPFLAHLAAPQTAIARGAA